MRRQRCHISKDATHWSIGRVTNYWVTNSQIHKYRDTPTCTANDATHWMIRGVTNLQVREYRHTHMRSQRCHISNDATHWRIGRATNSWVTNSQIRRYRHTHTCAGNDATSWVHRYRHIHIWYVTSHRVYVCLGHELLPHLEYEWYVESRTRRFIDIDTYTFDMWHHIASMCVWATNSCHILSTSDMLNHELVGS